ncbi:MAG: hypothetical protein U0939_10690 [Pirellulales bacterium]
MKTLAAAIAFVASTFAAAAWGQAPAVFVPAGPPLVGPAQMYVPAPQPVTTYYAPTVTALYPPTTLWNWWRPRPVVAYYDGSVITYPSTIPAAPVVTARPVTAYYPPPATALPVAPTTTYYPSTAVAAPAAPPVAAGPTVVYRPIVAPSQAYLYSRGPLGFPRVDAVPVATPQLVPVVIP